MIDVLISPIAEMACNRTSPGVSCHPETIREHDLPHGIEIQNAPSRRLLLATTSTVWDGDILLDAIVYSALRIQGSNFRVFAPHVPLNFTQLKLDI